MVDFNTRGITDIDDVKETVDKIEREFEQFNSLSDGDIRRMRDRQVVITAERILDHIKTLEAIMMALSPEDEPDFIEGVDPDRLERVVESGDPDRIRQFLME